MKNSRATMTMRGGEDSDGGGGRMNHRGVSGGDGSHDAECFKLLWNFVLLSLCCRLPTIFVLLLRLPTPMPMSRAESGSEVKMDDDDER